MPKKIRQLKAMLRQAGWLQDSGGGKGSHTTGMHPRVERKVTLSGNDGQDAKRYQEKDVGDAVREAEG
jgi:predicted RNA binding protein YcfA (HicA-like mRNA interferase family)